MKIRALIVVAATLAASTTFAATGKDFDRTLSVSGSPRISIATGSGYIHLHPGSETQVHIIGHVHANNSWGSGDAAGRIEQIVSHPPIIQDGNEIFIGPQHHDNELYRNIAIDYEVTLPKASAINANTGSGDIEIQNVGATLKAVTGSGTVRAGGVHGPADLQTGSGNISLQQTGGGDVRAQTGSGSIQLNGVSGGLRAGTGSGNIEAGGQPTSDWRLNTGSGSVQLNFGPSAHYVLNASTGSGSVHTSQPITMEGAIDRHHVQGTVNGGGPIIRVDTGSGNIEIR
jgi:DUF4097 and DUF4098 domain-containing protein YvlB